MNLQEIKVLFTFDSWANERLFDALSELPPGPYREDMKSSHGGIHGTLTHIVGAEKIWLSRWVGKPEKTVLQGSEVGSLAELKAIWAKVRQERDAFIDSLTDQKLQEPFTMTTTRGESFVHPHWQTFQHLANHSSYHRGQIAAMLRQLGFKPPATDLILFYRQGGRPG